MTLFSTAQESQTCSSSPALIRRNGPTMTKPSTIRSLCFHKAKIYIDTNRVDLGECGYALRENGGCPNVDNHVTSEELRDHYLRNEHNQPRTVQVWKDKDAAFAHYSLLNRGNPVVQEHDPVSHPTHYVSHPSGVECITITEHMSFCLGNATKYVWRAGLKSDDPIQDLKKARWYLKREMKRLKKLHALEKIGETPDFEKNPPHRHT